MSDIQPLEPQEDKPNKVSKRLLYTTLALALIVGTPIIYAGGKLMYQDHQKRKHIKANLAPNAFFIQRNGTTGKPSFVSSYNNVDVTGDKKIDSVMHVRNPSTGELERFIIENEGNPPQLRFRQYEYTDGKFKYIDD